MDKLLQDLRFTLRHLAKHPGLTIVIVLSLALGIGANTAIFSLIRGVVLRELPVRDAQRLVIFYWGGDTWPKGLSQSGAGGPTGTGWGSSSRSLPYPFYREIANDTTSFDAVIAFAPIGIGRENVTVAANGHGERGDGELVSGNFFEALGVTPAAGRLFTAADEAADSRLVVFSHSYWMRRFGGDPRIAGSSVSINNVPFVVAGIARQGFYGIQPGRMPDVWIVMADMAEVPPWGFRPSEVPSLLTATDYWWVQVMGRVKAGGDPRAAASALDARFQAFVAQALPEAEKAKLPHLQVEPGAAGLDLVRGEYERPLYLLMQMVGVVLLIACANVAVLLLSGSTARRREFALRLSLGASRWRLVRQLLSESLLLALAGGGLGILFSGWTSRALLYLLPSGERPLIENPIDGSVLAFAMLVSVTTALLFGIVPALVGTRVDLLPELKRTTSGTMVADHPAHRFWSSTLVVAQIALSLTLLVSAALFIRTMNHLHAQPLGVDHDRVLVFGMDASQNGYKGERLATLYREIVQRLHAMPGVESATAARLRLFGGWISNGIIRVVGQEPGDPQSRMIHSNGVGPEFAKTIGLRQLAGRDLSWQDLDAARHVAVVNEAMATHFFGNVGSAIGRRFSFSKTPDPASDYEIVGVVSNAKYGKVRGEFPRTAYLPYTANRASLGQLFMMVRTSGNPLRLAAAAREAVRSVEPSVALVDMDSMDGQIGDSLWRERMFARLTGAFGILALVLACIGLYGTIAYGVGRRRAEIAVRLALGAARRQILWMVLRRALALAIAGIAIGIPLMLWTSRFLVSQLVGVTPKDPVALAAGAMVLTAIAALAGYIPARRATLIEPAVALKQE
jgi:macrolide transport system ATP-binding/permease protein